MRLEAYQVQRAVVRLECSGCGAEANATCNCGKAYLPAKDRAIAAIKANPEKSNRALADEIGVGEATVRRARDETAPDDAVERVGLDGKTRRMPTYADSDDDDEPDADSARKAFLLRASAAHELARQYAGPIDNDVLELADMAASAWTQLAAQLRGKTNG